MQDVGLPSPGGVLAPLHPPIHVSRSARGGSPGNPFTLTFAPTGSTHEPTRAFLAAAVAGATITASGFAAAGTAGAATAPPKIYTKLDAGYTALGDGQRFQRIETSLDRGGDPGHRRESELHPGVVRRDHPELQGRNPSYDIQPWGTPSPATCTLTAAPHNRAIRRAGLWIILLVLGLHSAGELYRSKTAGPAGRRHGGRLRRRPR